VLFGIYCDPSSDLGHRAVIEVLKALGENVNKYCVPLGGFSARQGRDNILTILPHVSIAEARQLVDAIAEEFKTKTFPEIRSRMNHKMGVGTCFKISVAAGMAEGASSDSAEKILEKAKANQKIIAKYQCGKEDGLQ
jgi:GGDEF domain-containing protein